MIVGGGLLLFVAELVSWRAKEGEEIDWLWRQFLARLFCVRQCACSGTQPKGATEETRPPPTQNLLVAARTHTLTQMGP